MMNGQLFLLSEDQEEIDYRNIASVFYIYI
jgi:hypothetical protein